MKLHPIIIFAYNRSHHINILLNSLKRNYLFRKSKVIVFSDGPKNEVDKDKIDNLRILLKKKNLIHNILKLLKVIVILDFQEIL